MIRAGRGGGGGGGSGRGGGRDGPGRPRAVRPITGEELTPIERQALAADRSPALYHWNDLLWLPEGGGPPEVVYARGKDFVPYSALEYTGYLADRLRDPARGPHSIQ